MQFMFYLHLCLAIPWICEIALDKAGLMSQCYHQNPLVRKIGRCDSLEETSPIQCLSHIYFFEFLLSPGPHFVSVLVMGL